MYHFHTKKKEEDLTNTFEPLAKGGKRTNIVIWASVQSENPQNSP